MSKTKGLFPVCRFLGFFLEEEGFLRESQVYRSNAQLEGDKRLAYSKQVVCAMMKVNTLLYEQRWIRTHSAMCMCACPPDVLQDVILSSVLLK